MGRISVKDQVKLRKELLEYFEKGCNVLYTANKTKYNRKTVTQYFKEFGEQLIEDMTETFVARQKMAKEAAIKGLQEDMDLIDKQMVKLELAMDVAEAPLTLRTQYSTFLQMRANIRQQKCDIECTPTIDVSIDQMIEERVNEKSRNPSLKKIK